METSKRMEITFCFTPMPKGKSAVSMQLTLALVIPTLKQKGASLIIQQENRIWNQQDWLLMAKNMCFW